MKKTIYSIVFSCNLVITGAFAQTKQAQVKLILRDGNELSGTTNLGNISLITQYGKLEVPVQNAVSVQIGISEDKSAKDKITSLIKQLANSNEDMRKNAYNELVKMEAGAIPVISDYIYSEKYEPSTFSDYTADNALSELKSIHNVKDDFSTEDVVTMDMGYVMGGNYDFKKIDLKTDYGALTIAKNKIDHMDILYVNTGENSEKTFTLIASKHISSNENGGWLNTGIMLRKNQKFSIMANGEIVLESLSGQKYTPEGVVKTNTDDTDEGDDYNYSSSYPNYGNVVYKIGKDGEALKAGSSFKGNAKENGMLFLSIYETVYSTENTGSYKVKVFLK